MNSSFLYHAWGLYSHKCTREEYKGNTIILHVERKERQKTCPLCGHTHLVKNGYRIREFVGLPIGGKKTVPDMAYCATDMADNNENVIGYAYMKCSRQVVRIKQIVRRYCSEFV